MAAARAVPLTFNPLSTSDLTNNRAFCNSTYCLDNYPLPGLGGHALGWTLEGFELMPFFTPSGVNGKTGQDTFQRCELGACGDHVPEGGGGIHFHADPFGDSCLYSSSNYVASDGTVSTNAHPPLIGYSRDGAAIYGRYLSTSAPGFSDGLDSCGGHTHSNDPDFPTYHYHT
jgi:hypothetical protein